MTTAPELPGIGALTSNPSQFLNMAEDLELRSLDVSNLVTELRSEAVTYDTDQSGDDVDVIVAAIRTVANAYAQRVAGYASLAIEFHTAYSTLVVLETRSDSLDQTRSTLVSADPDSEDLDTTAATAVSEFAAIQADEIDILKRLAGAIEGTPIGDDIDVPHTTWLELIDRLIIELDRDDVPLELEVASIAVLDHAEGGDVDGVEDAEALLEEGELSVAAIVQFIDDEEILAAIADETLSPEALQAVADGTITIEQLEQIAAGEIDEELAAGVIAGELKFPTPEISQHVTEAILNGETPEEAGIDARYFPPNWEDLPSGDDDTINHVQAVTAVAQAHGTREWQGQQLAEIYNPDLPESTQKVIAETLQESPVAAASFFNEIGVDQTVEIPNGVENPETVEEFGRALAAATQATDGQGAPALEFTGEELILESRNPPDGGLPLRWPAEYLLAEGDFEPTFLAEATGASLSYPDTIPNHPGSQKTTRFQEHFGTDTRNIPLRRASETPAVAQAVVAQLESNGDIDLLLNPPIPYNPDDRADHPLKYPIGTFLETAGRDRSTAIVIFSAASEVDQFSDPGVAVGVDAIMAKHPTVMYPESDLERHGIDPGDRMTRADWEESGLSMQDWVDLQQKVTYHGQGVGLVIANEGLIEEAIAHDLQDGQLDDDYYILGFTQGILEKQVQDGAIAVAERTDADNDGTNRRQAAALSTVLALGGGVVGSLGGPLGAAGGAAAGLSIVDILYGYWGVASTENTSNTEKTLRELYEASDEHPDGLRYERIAREQAILAQERRHQANPNNPPPADDSGNRLRVRDGQVQRETSAGDWETVDIDDVALSRSTGPGDTTIGQIGASAGGKLGESHAKGVEAVP